MTTAYTTDELRALSVVELGGVLNDIDKEMPLLVKAANEADVALCSAQTILIYHPQNLDARAAEALHKTTLRIVLRNLQALRSKQSRVQSACKMAAI